MIVLKTIFALKMFRPGRDADRRRPWHHHADLRPLYVYTIGFVHYDMGLASALAWILTIVLVAIGAFYIRLVLPAPERA